MTKTVDVQDCSDGASQARVENPCHKDAWLALAVGLLTFLVFCPVLRHGFVEAWDDNIAITDNPDYNPPRISNLLHYWVPPPHEEFYVPVTYTLWGLVAMTARSVQPNGTVNFNPLPFHAINLGAHVLSAVLVFLVLRQLVTNRWAAFVGTILFALHPIQTEAVAWASSMYTPLCGMLGLAAIWQFLRFSARREAGQTRAAQLHFVLATLFFVLSMLTKPAAASVPLILAAIELGWRRRSPRVLVLPLGFWVLLCIPIIVATKLGNPASAMNVAEPWQKPLVALDAIAFYLYKIVWPVALCPDYGRSPNWVLDHPQAWLACLAPIALCIALWWFRRHIRGFVAAAGVFAAALLPTLGFTSFNFQAFSTVADRFAYLAMLGVAMAAALALSRATAKVLAPIALALALGLGALAVLQLRHWQNVWTLFAYTIEANPDSRVVGGNTGFLLAPQIEAHCTLSPTQLTRMADQLLRQRRSLIAIPLYRFAMTRGPVDPAAYDDLADALVQNEKLNEAMEVCREALGRNPRDAAAHATLGNIYIRSDPAKAAAEYRQALQIDPSNAIARRGLAALEHVQ